MVSFSNQNPKVQKNVSYENMKVLKNSLFHWIKVAGVIISHIQIRTPEQAQPNMQQVSQQI